MNAVIPEDAVAAAAKAMFEMAVKGKVMQPLDIARTTLEAAAPHMLAGAWESGYTLGYADCANKQESNRPNPHKEES